MEQKCKVCNKTLTIDDYRRFDLCKDCYSKGMKLLEDEKKNNPSYNSYSNTSENKKLGALPIFVLIIIMLIALISGFSGDSSKSSKRYDYITKSDGTRQWYDTTNPRIVIVDK